MEVPCHCLSVIDFNNKYLVVSRILKEHYMQNVLNVLYFNLVKKAHFFANKSRSHVYENHVIVLIIFCSNIVCYSVYFL